jgi:hypothetical protein
VTVPALVGGVALLSTVFLWTPRYCCGSEMVTLLGPVRAISGMVEEIRANLKD